MSSKARSLKWIHHSILLQIFCQTEHFSCKGGPETGEPGNVKHQASDGQLERVTLTTNCSLAIHEEDQRPQSIRKGGTVCISKSKEWNGLAPSPKRATYPASLMRLKCGFLPEPELLSCLRASLLVFTDDLLIDGSIVPLLPFSLFWRTLAGVENSGEALISSWKTKRLLFGSTARRSPPSGGRLWSIHRHCVMTDCFSEAHIALAF